MSELFDFGSSPYCAVATTNEYSVLHRLTTSNKILRLLYETHLYYWLQTKTTRIALSDAYISIDKWSDVIVNLYKWYSASIDDRTCHWQCGNGLGRNLKTERHLDFIVTIYNEKSRVPTWFLKFRILDKLFISYGSAFTKRFLSLIDIQWKNDEDI